MSPSFGWLTGRGSRSARSCRPTRQNWPRRFDTADAETLHARFLGGPPRLTDAVLDGLTRVDYVSHFALVARTGGRGVAVARYASPPLSGAGSVVAEIAVAVAAEWRRVGLATALVELLTRRAQECGITEFTALFLAQNRPVTEAGARGTCASGDRRRRRATARRAHDTRPRLAQPRSIRRTAPVTPLPWDLAWTQRHIVAPQRAPEQGLSALAADRST